MAASIADALDALKEGREPETSGARALKATELIFATYESARRGRRIDLPLVLVESMAAGCIPIAYDIRYGPSDVIRDGVDGFLVAEGDVEAMAERILRLQSMSPQQREAMRAAAVVRAAEFSDAAVTARWAALLAEAETAGASAPSPSTLLARLRGRAGRLRRRLRRR